MAKSVSYSSCGPIQTTLLLTSQGIRIERLRQTGSMLPQRLVRHSFPALLRDGQRARPTFSPSRFLREAKHQQPPDLPREVWRLQQSLERRVCPSINSTISGLPSAVLTIRWSWVNFGSKGVHAEARRRGGEIAEKRDIDKLSASSFSASPRLRVKRLSFRVRPGSWNCDREPLITDH